MPNYSEGKIYKIIAETNEDFLPYVGSTIQKLSKRMTQHRDNYKLFLEGKDRIRSKACDLFQKFGVKNCRIVLIENFSCKTIEELTSRERYWYDNIKNCNAQKPQRTIEEIMNYQDNHYGQKIECNCGSIYRKGDKARHERSQKHILGISQK
jgi:hypothetical protein